MENYFHTLLGLTTTECSIGFFTINPPFKLVGIDKNHLKCICSDESIVNGTSQPFSFYIK